MPEDTVGSPDDGSLDPEAVARSGIGLKRRGSATVAPSFFSGPPDRSAPREKVGKKKKKEVTPEDAFYLVEDARTRVLLDQEHAGLDATGNFCSDSFTSFMDEVTGIVTMVTVYQKENQVLYKAALVVYGINIFVRLLVGLRALLFPPHGVQFKGTDKGRVSCTTVFKMIGSILLVMLEPVAGIRLINSAHEPSPALTEEDRQNLLNKKSQADNAENDAAARFAEAVEKEKAARQKAKSSATQMEKGTANTENDVFGFGAESIEEASQKLFNAMADITSREKKIIEMEAKVAIAEAPILRDESNVVLAHAEMSRAKRQLRLEITQLGHTEQIELVMALFEDLPELVLSAVFLGIGGIDGASGSDVSLFATSAFVSFFHAAKCMWSWHQHRGLIRRAETGHVGRDIDTHGGYFIDRKVFEPEKVIKKLVAGRDSEVSRKALIPEKKKAEKARREWQSNLDAIEAEAGKTNDVATQQAIAERKKNEFRQRIERKKGSWFSKVTSLAEASQFVLTANKGAYFVIGKYGNVHDDGSGDFMDEAMITGFTLVVNDNSVARTFEGTPETVGKYIQDDDGHVNRAVEQILELMINPVMSVNQPAQGYLPMASKDMLVLTDDVTYMGGDLSDTTAALAVGPGVYYSFPVRYVGSIQVMENMRLLHILDQTAVCQEAIARCVDAADIRTKKQKKRKVSSLVQKFLAESPYIGVMELKINLSVEGIATSSLDTNEIISNDDIAMISIASGGSQNEYDFLTYVGVDKRSNRYCHVFDCSILVDDVLATIGQIFNILTNGQEPAESPAVTFNPSDKPISSEGKKLNKVASVSFINPVWNGL